MIKRNIFLWLIAFIITAVIASYQRITGPTYPITGKTYISSDEVRYKFDRSHGGSGDQIINIVTKNEKINGDLFFRRYKTDEEWQIINMKYSTGNLSASLPHQPPAGKLEYFVKLYSDGSEMLVPNDRTVVIRFKGAVPIYILIPHIIAMFGAMLISTRTGLEIFAAQPSLKKLTIWTIAFLFAGGFILGPIVQKFAFGEFWTGFPYGHDLTDNKTFIAIGGWAVAYFMYKKSVHPKRWALFASILLLAVYLIPHSVMGSELDYSKVNNHKSVSNYLSNAKY